MIQRRNFILLSDPEHKLSEKLEVWKEKSMYGKKYMGTFRTTFITDENGIITHIIDSKTVRTKEHAQQILKIVQ